MAKEEQRLLSKLFSQNKGARPIPKIERFKGFESNFESQESEVFDMPPLEVGSSAMEDSTAWEPAYSEDPFQQKGILSPRIQKLMDEARQETERMLAAAEEQANQMLDAAQKRSEQIEAEAYQKAFEQGEIAGRQLGEQKLDMIIRNLRGIIDSFAAQQDVIFRSNEEEFVKIAFMISLQLIQRELHQDPTVILDVVRAALAKVQRASRLTLFVSPHDFRFLENQLELLQTLTRTGTQVSVEPDDSIHRGGCRVVSDTGEIDATIDLMLENIRNRIWEQE